MKQVNKYPVYLQAEIIELKNMRQQLRFCVQKLNKIKIDHDFCGRLCRKCPTWKFEKVEDLWKTEMSEVEYESFLVDNPWIWQIGMYYGRPDCRSVVNYWVSYS